MHGEAWRLVSAQTGSGRGWGRGMAQPCGDAGGHLRRRQAGMQRMKCPARALAPGGTGRWPVVSGGSPETSRAASPLVEDEPQPCFRKEAALRADVRCGSHRNFARKACHAGRSQARAEGGRKNKARCARISSGPLEITGQRPVPPAQIPRGFPDSRGWLSERPPAAISPRPARARGPVSSEPSDRDSPRCPRR